MKNVVTLRYDLLTHERPSKAIGQHSFLRFNHRNPEQKNENVILIDAFLKDLSNACNNLKPGLATFFDVSDKLSIASSNEIVLNSSDVSYT